MGKAKSAEPAYSPLPKEPVRWHEVREKFNIGEKQIRLARKRGDLHAWRVGTAVFLDGAEIRALFVPLEGGR